MSGYMAVEEYKLKQFFMSPHFTFSNQLLIPVYLSKEFEYVFNIYIVISDQTCVACVSIAS